MLSEVKDRLVYCKLNGLKLHIYDLFTDEHMDEMHIEEAIEKGIVKLRDAEDYRLDIKENSLVKLSENIYRYLAFLLYKKDNRYYVLSFPAKYNL